MESTRPREQDVGIGRIGAIEQTAAFKQLAKGVTVSPTEKQNTPFVILMGWINCGDKYLAKYSELLSKLGYSSLRTIQPTFTGFSVAETPRRIWASNILDFLLDRQEGSGRPLVFYPFSNGGCWVYEQLVPLLQHEQRYEPIRAALTGLIFESGPCVMTAQSGRTSLSSGTAFPMKQLLEAVFLVILALTFLLAGNTPKRFWNCMLNEKVSVPRLYFYSADDDLCDAKELEALLDKKRQQGLDLTVKRWEHSAHCAHLRKHPVEYVAALKTFLSKVSK